DQQPAAGRRRLEGGAEGGAFRIAAHGDRTTGNVGKIACPAAGRSGQLRQRRVLFGRRGPQAGVSRQHVPDQGVQGRGHFGVEPRDRQRLPVEVGRGNAGLRERGEGV